MKLVYNFTTAPNTYFSDGSQHILNSTSACSFWYSLSFDENTVYSFFVKFIIVKMLLIFVFPMHFWGYRCELTYLSTHTLTAVTCTQVTRLLRLILLHRLSFNSAASCPHDLQLTHTVIHLSIVHCKTKHKQIIRKLEMCSPSLLPMNPDNNTVI